MLAALLQIRDRAGIGFDRYGFFGIEGIFGVIIGLIVFVVIVALLFKIEGKLLIKLGVDAGWTEIIYWVLVLLIFIAFLHFFGLY